MRPTPLENLAALYRATNQDTEAEPAEQRAARIRTIKRIKAALMIFFRLIYFY
jgi:hypothetical protein